MKSEAMTTPAHKTGRTARDDKGRFLAMFCDDRNCCGTLMIDSWFGRPVWQCDGLTYDRDDGPLRPCTRSYPALSATRSTGDQS